MKLRHEEEFSVEPNNGLMKAIKVEADDDEISAEAFGQSIPPPEFQSTPCKSKSSQPKGQAVQPQCKSQKILPQSQKVAAKIIVNWPSGVKTRILSDELIPIGKSLINGSFKQIASAA